MLLVYKKSDGSEATIRLKTISHTPPVTLGRDKSATVQIDDPECSRIHCAIRYWDDIFVIRDMNSHNGTLVNGKKIDVAKLHFRDIIKIGNTEIRVQVEPSSSDVTVSLAHPEHKE